MKMELFVKDGKSKKTKPLCNITISITDPSYSYLEEVLEHQIKLMLHENFNPIRAEMDMDTIFVGRKKDSN